MLEQRRLAELPLEGAKAKHSDDLSSVLHCQLATSTVIGFGFPNSYVCFSGWSSQ